jgi:dynein heavy chain
VHYSDVYQLVAPKKAKLAKLTDELNESRRKLEHKRKELSDIEQKLNGLRKQYDEKKSEGVKLKNKIKDTKVRLQRAEKLITGLAAEQEQWSTDLAELEEQTTYVVGTMLLSAAALSYFGPFTSDYRQELITLWSQACTSKGVKLPAKFRLVDFLTDPLHVHEWTTNGLPSDSLSIENAILSKRGVRWPLMIDPQGYPLKRYQS